MGLKHIYLVMGAVLLGLGIAGAGGEWPRLGMAMIFAGLGSSYKGVQIWRDEREMLQLRYLGDVEEERAALLQESYDKAVHDYRLLEQSRRELHDPALSQQIGKLQQISGNMLRYLEKNPQKLPLAQRFIDYYQDRAVMLVGKYQEFEATNLKTNEMQAMKERLRVALEGLDEAYEEQFQRLLNDQFLDLDAEIKVMEQTMDAEGILPRSPEEPLAGGGTEKGGMAEQGGMEDPARYPFGQREAITNPMGQQREMDGGSGFRGPMSPRSVRAHRRARSLSIIPPGEMEDVKRTRNIQSFCGIFLGGLGVHKFYQRKFVWGVLYVLLSWTPLPWLAGFCEGMRYLFMRLDDFYEQYYLDRL